MATKPRIHLVKGDTLIRYTLQRHPTHGVDLSFTVHPHFQRWLQRVSEESMEQSGGENATTPLTEVSNHSSTGLQIADEKGDEMWRVNMNSVVTPSTYPNLRLGTNARRTLTNLAWLRLCVGHLDRKVRFPLLTDFDLWDKQWDERTDTKRFVITMDIDHAIRELRLKHVTLDVPKATVTHTIR